MPGHRRARPRRTSAAERGRSPRPDAALRIRPYRPTDRPYYARAVVDLQDHLTALDPFGVVRRAPAYGVRYVRAAIGLLRKNRGGILIAERDGRPVGFVAAYVRPRNRVRDLELRPGRHGFVMDLFVDPSARGHGVGTALLRAAERFLARRGCTRVWLGVFVPNARAHALYRRLGYADFGVTMTARLDRPGARGRRRTDSGRSS
ncbi:MAG TPA: GNAT family N-acetyltransferase [Thermoplasmata archaeon]|nr:GNAT family N-acetyltransferase [Thermoplasmata archaeon]